MHRPEHNDTLAALYREYFGFSTSLLRGNFTSAYLAAGLAAADAAAAADEAAAAAAEAAAARQAADAAEAHARSRDDARERTRSLLEDAEDATGAVLLGLATALDSLDYQCADAEDAAAAAEDAAAAAEDAAEDAAGRAEALAAAAAAAAAGEDGHAAALADAAEASAARITALLASLPGELAATILANRADLCPGVAPLADGACAVCGAPEPAAARPDGTCPGCGAVWFLAAS